MNDEKQPDPHILTPLEVMRNQIEYYFNNSQEAQSEMASLVRESCRSVMLFSLAVVVGLGQLVEHLSNCAQYWMALPTLGLLLAAYLSYHAAFVKLARYSKVKYDLFARAHKETTTWLLAFSTAIEKNQNEEVDRLMSTIPDVENPNHGGYSIDDTDFKGAQSQRNFALIISGVSILAAVIVVVVGLQAPG